MQAVSGKVLIIDDEPTLRSTLARILRTGGCDTDTAADGVQALQLLDAATYDLVYLDLHLPELDGIQILTQIRKQYPYLPVIMLTGFGSLQTSVEALRLGALDYLLKPFDPEVLLAKTRLVLQEQALERRKRELRERIAALQTELTALEQAASPTDVIVPDADRRFFRLGRLTCDLQARRATLGPRPLELPPSTFDYLLVLARYSPDVVDYVSLVSEAQHYRVEGIEARELAKYHVHVLRQTMEQDPQHPRYILNVRGIGYRLLAD